MNWVVSAPPTELLLQQTAEGTAENSTEEPEAGPGMRVLDLATDLEGSAPVAPGNLGGRSAGLPTRLEKPSRTSQMKVGGYSCRCRTQCAAFERLVR